jgi:MFS family permease
VSARKPSTTWPVTPLAPCTASLATGPVTAAGAALPRALATAVAVVTASILPALLVAALAVDMGRDLALDTARLGIALGAFWGAAALSSMTAGRFVDRFGAGRGVHVAGALTAASTLSIALVVESHATLVAALVVAGAAFALAGPGMSALVGRRLQPSRRGTVLGVQQSGPPVAMLLAGLALPLVAAPLGWRPAFAGASAFALLAAAAVRSRDCRAAAHPQARHGGAGAALGLAVAGGLGAAVASTGVTFLAPHAAAEGLGASAAGFAFAAASLAAVATRVALGVRADRAGGDRLLPVAALLAIGTAGFALLAAGGGPATVLAGALLALGLGWGWNGLFVLAALERRPDAPGAGVAAAMSGVYVGALAGPLLGGVVAETVSLAAMWGLCSALSAAGAAVLLAVRRPARSPARPRAEATAVRP